MSKLFNKTQGYTSIPQSVTRNSDLDLKERGLLLTLMSLPDNWEYSIIGLSKIVPNGKTSIGKLVRQLEAKGYIRRIKNQDEKGHFWYDWEVFAEPHPEYYNPENVNDESDESFHDQTVQNETPVTGKQSVETAQINNVEYVQFPQTGMRSLENQIPQHVENIPQNIPLSGKQSVASAQNINHNIMHNAHTISSNIHGAQNSGENIVQFPQTANPSLENPSMDLRPQSNTKEVITKDIYLPLHNCNNYIDGGRDGINEEDSYILSLNERAYKTFGMSDEACTVNAIFRDELANAKLTEPGYYKKLVVMTIAEVNHIYEVYCSGSNTVDIKQPEKYIRKVIRNTALTGFKPAATKKYNPRKEATGMYLHNNSLYTDMLNEMAQICEKEITQDYTNNIVH